MLAGLLLSLILHILILDRWPVQRTEYPRTSPGSDISFELRRYRPPPVTIDTQTQETANAEPASERRDRNPNVEPDAAQRLAPAPLPPPAQQGRNPDLPTRLDLRLRESDPPSFPPAGARSERQGRVFDPRLAEQLEDLRTRPGRRAESERSNGTLSEITRMSGSQLSTFVRVGKRCFEVIEADPLDQFSREQWYAVDCAL